LKAGFQVPSRQLQVPKYKEEGD